MVIRLHPLFGRNRRSIGGMVKGASEWREETERPQHAQKENDVSRRSQEDCRSATSTVGEGKSGSEEDCVTGTILADSVTRVQPESKL